MAKRTQEQQEYRDNLAHDLKNLRNRYGGTGKELAQTLLDDQKYERHYEDKYINSLGDGRKLNKKDALKMIEKDPTLVSEHLDQFKGLDNEVAQKLIKEGEISFVLSHLASFEGLNKDTANKILDFIPSDTMVYFLNRLSSFNTLDEEILLKILKKIPERKNFYNDSNFSDYYNKTYNLIKNNIDRFEGVSLDKDLAQKMIEAGFVQQVIANIKDFDGIDSSNIKIV